MKTSALLVAAAAAVPAALASSNADPLSFGSFSEPEVERRADTDLSSTGQVVIDALYQIGNATVNLGNQIADFTVLGLVDLQTASLAEVAIINQGITNVTNSPDMLQTVDLLPLLVTVGNLATAVNTTLDLLISKKQDLGGAAFVVNSSLSQQITATNSLNAAVAKKTPSELLKSAAVATAPIIANLSAAQLIFQEPNVNPASAYTGAASSLSANVGAGVIAAAVAVSTMLLL